MKAYLKLVYITSRPVAPGAEVDFQRRPGLPTKDCLEPKPPANAIKVLFGLEVPGFEGMENTGRGRPDAPARQHPRQPDRDVFIGHPQRIRSRYVIKGGDPGADSRGSTSAAADPDRVRQARLLDPDLRSPRWGH